MFGYVAADFSVQRSRGALLVYSADPQSSADEVRPEQASTPISELDVDLQFL